MENPLINDADKNKAPGYHVEELWKNESNGRVFRVIVDSEEPDEPQKDEQGGSS